MKVLAAVVGMVVVGLGAIWLFQRSLIYFPIDSVPPIDTVLPGGEEVTFPTEDGLILTGWYLPVSGDNETTVIVFNGNAGNRSHRAPLGQALTDQGFAVLLTDYRGYGGNPGSPSEEGLVLDAAAAIAYLETRPDVGTDRLVYFGESLGAGVVAQLGMQHEPKVKGLVLITPWDSLRTLARTHYPWLPASLFLKHPMDSIAALRLFHKPIAVLVADRDEIVGAAGGLALAQALAVARLVRLPNSGHNEWLGAMTLRHWDELLSPF